MRKIKEEKREKKGKTSDNHKKETKKKKLFALTLPLVCFFVFGLGFGRFRVRWGPKGPNSPNPSFSFC